MTFPVHTGHIIYVRPLYTFWKLFNFPHLHRQVRGPEPLFQEYIFQREIPRRGGAAHQHAHGGDDGYLDPPGGGLWDGCGEPRLRVPPRPRIYVEVRPGVLPAQLGGHQATSALVQGVSEVNYNIEAVSAPGCCPWRRVWPGSSQGRCRCRWGPRWWRSPGPVWVVTIRAGNEPSRSFNLHHGKVSH